MEIACRVQRRKELQEYYEEIMTDEYQDSNYVQEMILTSISRGPEQSPYLFMVGDVKQSIYQFRLARPDLFMEKYHAYDTEEGGNRRIDLRQNFRSRASVLESANYIFERIMRQDFGGIAYDDAAKISPLGQYLIHAKSGQRIRQKLFCLIWMLRRIMILESANWKRWQSDRRSATWCREIIRCMYPIKAGIVR